MIQSYLQFSDIIVDGIYGQALNMHNIDNGCDNSTQQSASKSKKDKNKTDQKNN